MQTLEQGVQALVWECLEALEKQSNANAGGKSEVSYDYSYDQICCTRMLPCAV